MHSKVIIASLACVMAASFANGRATNVSAAKALQPKVEQASCCSAPNEDGINAVLYADKPYQSNDFCVFLQGLEYQSQLANHLDLIAKSPEIGIWTGYSPAYGYYFDASQPAADGDYFVTMGSMGRELATLYIYRSNGVCYGSVVSKFDARAKYYMNEVATSTERSYYPQSWGGSVTLNSTTAINAVKHYGTYVYSGTSDMTMSLSTTQKSGWNDFGSNLSIKVQVEMYKNGTVYPVESARVRLFTSGTEITPGTTKRTGTAGTYTYSMNFMDTFNKTLGNIQVGVFTDCAQGRVKDNFGFDSPYIYTSTSSTQLFNLKTITYKIRVYPERSDRAAAYEVSQAAIAPYKYTNYYASTVTGAKILYPAEKTSYFTSFNNYLGVEADQLITIKRPHYNVWDVIDHEYGHFICDKLNLSKDPSNDVYWTHEFDEDLIQTTNEWDNGLRMAYSEGLATYIGVASQLDYATRVSSNSYCATFADEQYNDPINDVSADFNQYRFGVHNGYFGQAVESSVASTLIKLMDNVSRTDDSVALGHLAIWNAIRNAGGNTADIHSFIAKLVEQNPSAVQGIYKILDREYIPHPSIPTPPSSQADWTILMYVCGSTLETEQGYQASSAISDIVGVLNQPSKVNIVIQTGGCNDDWGNSNIPQNTVARWTVRNNQLVPYDLNVGNISMGAESTFEDFLNWGFDEFPAEKTGVIIWNHGGGLEGVCYDYNFPINTYPYDPYDVASHDTLLNSEAQTAFANAFAEHGIDKLEFIGYDACMMQLQDVAEFNSQYFNYMVASSIPTSELGWNYNAWISTLYNYQAIKNNPSLYPDGETITILKSIVDSFIYNGYSWEQTLSILDLSVMSDYHLAFEMLARAIRNRINSGVIDVNYLRNVASSCPNVYGEHEYGQVDCYTLLQRLKEEASYNQISTSMIDLVLSYFPSNYVVTEDPNHDNYLSGFGSGNGLVIYWRASLGYQGSYPITRGLAVHVSRLVRNYQTNNYDVIYPASETNFNDWRSLWFL